jgi:hypothetical protein
MGNCFRQSAGPNLFKSDWLAGVAKRHEGIAALLAELYSKFASIKYRRIGYTFSSLFTVQPRKYCGKDTVVYLFSKCYSPILFLYKPVIAVILSNMNVGGKN